MTGENSVAPRSIMKALAGRGLHAEHLDDLRKSGLSDSTIGEAGLYSESGQALIRLCGRKIPDGATGLVFEYDRTFARVKLFPSMHGRDGRSIKYLQPHDSPVRAYVLDSVRPFLSDPSRPLHITEGEKKALKMTQEGLPAIGLGGVWNFRTKDLPTDRLIPDLEAVAWRDRTVYLVPDSDTWTNRNVFCAIFRLGLLLEARGATALVVHLPDGHQEAKVGVDDFLVEHGVSALRGLVERAVRVSRELFTPGLRRRGAASQGPIPPAPVPPELSGRRIHPATHFDMDGFASVGILDGNEWHIITSARQEYPAASILSVLTRPPIAYPLDTRWRKEDRERYLKRAAPDLSWGTALSQTVSYFRDYLDLESEAQYAILALWTLSTYIHQALPSFPHLNLLGEKSSGKTKVLRLVSTIALNGLWRTAPRPAAIFRLVEALRPTLCLDELESLDRESRGDIDAILNAGYQKGGAVDRCEPKSYAVRAFEVYAPVALAGIRGLNPVLADRCITLVLQPGRDRARLNRDVDSGRLDPQVEPIRDLAYRLALDRWQAIQQARDRLELPGWLAGRSRELWSPLLALADVAAAEGAFDFRPALLEVARPDAEERSELHELSAAVLTALEMRLGGQGSKTIQPGELVADLRTILGYEVTPHTIGLRLKALRFIRAKNRKTGSCYTVTLEAIQRIRDRHQLQDD